MTHLTTVSKRCRHPTAIYFESSGRDSSINEKLTTILEDVALK